MRISTTLLSGKKDKTVRSGLRGFTEGIIAILAWLLIWQLASVVIKQEMLLASPVSVGNRLIEIVQTAVFWRSAFFSISRVSIGFLLALVVGTVLAVLAYRFRVAAVFLRPFMEITKAVPVVSYIILCLLFFSSKNISVSISFLMGLPIIYTNILEGLNSTDKKLLEMATVYGVPPLKRAVYIYFSQLMSFLISACSIALGLCWKSGIAAEVIGLPLGSIGEHMYQAKVFVDTKSLLAWTVVVIILSFTFERVLLAVLKRLMAAVEKK